MAYYQTGCPGCRQYRFVENSHDGDVTCTSCGLVVESHMLVSPLYCDHSEIMLQFETQGKVEKKKNREIDNKVQACCVHLNLPESVQENVFKMFQTVRQAKCFRGHSLDAVIGAVIYVSCRQCIPRAATEIHTPLGINANAFNKALKVLCHLFPDLTQTSHAINESDSIIRQIRRIDDIPDNHIWKIARQVESINIKRLTCNMLLGSPPCVVNAVLIYFVCQKMGIKLNKTKYVATAALSRATLDKHVRSIGMIT